MTELVIKDKNGNINVRYKTDIIEDNATFTVMEVVGLSEAETVIGLAFPQNVTSLSVLEDFCVANNLALDLIPVDSTGDPVKVLVATGTITDLAATAAAIGGNDTILLTPEVLLHTGGNGKVTWTVDAGTTDPLPAGLLLSAEGVVGGTPTEIVTNSVTFLVTDAFGQTDTVVVVITIAA